MVTIGTYGKCQGCGQMGMESEKRWNEERAECPHCGLYYEVGPVSHIAPHYLPEPEHTPFLASLSDALRADGWYITGEFCFRVGVINRPLSAAPRFSVINSWFTLPAPQLQRVTPSADADGGTSLNSDLKPVRWFKFDHIPVPRFIRSEWYVEDTPD